ncbi:MAG: hypothetical protein R3B57_02565 [Phycisphaerales bacterium]
MSRLLGTLLLLLGVTIIAIGLVGALREIRDLYQGVTTDAMAEPAVPEEERPNRILTDVAIGALGVPPLLAGSVLLTRSKIRLLHKMMKS